jgi:hypothetical protein
MNETQVKALFALLETGHTAKEIIESLTAHHEYAMEIAATAF